MLLSLFMVQCMDFAVQSLGGIFFSTELDPYFFTNPIREKIFTVLRAEFPRRLSKEQGTM